VNPDVISLNENRNSTMQSVASTLRTQTGEPWAAYWLDRGDGDGVGIMTKHEYVQLGILRFANWIKYRRVALAGQITHRTTRKRVTFITTHLVAPESVESGSTAVRVLQAAELEGWARQFAEPRLVAGDLNEDRRYANAIDNELIPYYYDGWEEAVKKEAATGQEVAVAEYSDGRTRPTTRLDYILYSRSASGVTLRETRVWPMLYSDHRAVSCIFEFR
ncbi:MAG TPA: endonuclease/exonuclease/phosphatase family protein, partial [Bdellovibrionota bacterium]|nr:endonuclease/exonuclease/phosphatase family protein [Bdellovibrionota bacterium]